MIDDLILNDLTKIFIFKSINKILKKYNYGIAYTNNQLVLINRLDCLNLKTKIPNIWSWANFNDFLFNKNQGFSENPSVKQLSIFEIFNNSTYPGKEINKLKSESIEEITLKLTIMGYCQSEN
jgi:hypothetical protein